MTPTRGTPAPCCETHATQLHWRSASKSTLCDDALPVLKNWLLRCVCVCGVALRRHCIDCSLVTCWHVMLQGKHAHALRQLREVRKYAPRCNEAIVLNIECLLAMGRVDEAYGETQDILAENTHNSKFLHMRARCLYLQV